jgi:hypothetical protein
MSVDHTLIGFGKGPKPATLTLVLPPPPPAPSPWIAVKEAERKLAGATTEAELDAAFAELLIAHAAVPEDHRPPTPRREKYKLLKVDAISDAVSAFNDSIRTLAGEFAQAKKNRDAAGQERLFKRIRAELDAFDPILKAQKYLTKLSTEDKEPIKFSDLATILSRGSQTEWLHGLDEILERSVLAMIAGKRGTLKSFITLEWAMRAAVEGCGVILLSGEGAGLDRRIDAWLRKHGAGLDRAKLRIVALEKPVNLNQQQTLDRVAEAIKALGWDSVDLVVVDTMSKFTPGMNEQDNTANAEFLYRVSATLRYQLGAAVLLVDHEGHDANGRPRGASVKMANPDAEYMVTRLNPDDPNKYEVAITRQRFKDAAALPDLWYVGEKVDLGRLDDKGRPVDSLAFVRVDAPSVSSVMKPARRTPTGANARTAWDALCPIFAAAPPSPKGAPACVPLHRVAVNEEEATTMILGKFKAGKRQHRDAERGIDNLIKQKFIVRGDGWLWPTNVDERNASTPDLDDFAE